MNSHPFLLALVVSTSVSTAAPSFAQQCSDLPQCKQQALDAAARQDYNAFHDLAWRTMQLGPKNDPAAMAMLARAQSLSGRPGDALVMLQRLAAMGIVTDAATSEDFANVRALPGWAELEAKTSGTPVSEKVAAPPKPDVKPAEPKPVEAKPVPPAKADPKPSEPAVASPTPEPVKVEPAPKGKPGAKVPTPLVFSAPSLSVVGLGYDAVSGRFIVADGKERRLLVVGERSARLASLAGIDAGFDDVSAFEIDSVEGDLWVASSSVQSGTAKLHKLQLISGRVLTSIALGSDEGLGRFTDVAVTPQNILVLDGEGRRLYRVAKKGKTLDMVAELAAPSCTTVAPGPDGVAYAAFDRGVLRIDLTTKALTVVDAPDRHPLDKLRWMRWHRGSLVAIQGDPGGPLQLVRLRLDEAGKRVRSVDVLDANVALAGPTSATLSGGSLFYLAAVGDDRLEVKKLVLK